jgi:hypothetical protein
MKTITGQIVERLEQLANEWSDHTPQCEALFMAAKEALTFQDTIGLFLCGLGWGYIIRPFIEAFVLVIKNSLKK